MPVIRVVRTVLAVPARPRPRPRSRLASSAGRPGHGIVIVVLVAVIVALAAVTVVVVGNGTPAAGAPCWRPPVVGEVTDPFREPPCRWCAGNRGLEYSVGSNVPVRAVAGGRVTFAGSVAGVRYVVVELVGGWKVTYGRLERVAVEPGSAVVAGAVLGRASDEFFFGLRVRGDYRDPAPYLGVPRRRPYLVPADGSPGRRPPPVTWRCSAGRGRPGSPPRSAGDVVFPRR